MSKTHVRRLVPDFILSQFSASRMGGRMQAASLFVDISGFTQLTETLMQHQKDGAEVLTEVLNSIFQPIVHEVDIFGGTITTFAGDAFTAIFPTSQQNAALSALQVAGFVNQFFATNGIVETIYGTFEMGVKVGLSFGEVEWGILGTESMHTFFYRGEAIDNCARAEHFAQQGEVIADALILPNIAAYVMAEPLEDHYRIKVELPVTEPKEQHKPVIHAQQLQPFILDAVINLPQMAEFRDVSSIFIAFDEPDHAEDLNLFVSSMLRLARDYGGYFNKLDFGDKGSMIVVLFGAPLAYEDNTHRAADFLLALKAEVKHVRWRAGLTVGTVYAGIMGGDERCEYTAIGDIVNISARLVMKAPVDQIWTSENVFERLSSSYHFEALGHFQFKGKGAPVAAYQLESKQISVAGALFSGRIVGRDAELAELRVFLNPIFSQSKNQRGSFTGICYIFGEPGIGKSRLIYELRQNLSSEHDLRWIYCPADGILRESLNPFRYYLREYFQQSPNNTLEQNRSNFDAVFEVLLQQAPANDPETERLQRELFRTRSMLGALVGVTWQDSLYERLEPKLRFENTLSAFVSFVQFLSRISPIVIEVDDGHVLDADSKELLRLISRLSVDDPIAVLISSRYESGGQKPKLDVQDSVPELEVDLNYLSSEGVQAFAEQILDAELEEDAVEFLASKTNGNPYFIEQLALDLEERHLLVDSFSNGHRVLTLASLSSEDVPTSIGAVLISRIDRLDSEVKQVVQTASVLGREFEQPILAKMLPDDPALDIHIHQAETESIWTELGEKRLLFKHALLRDSVYDMQLRSRLRELHRLAAEAIEQAHGTESHAFAVDLAYHFEKAGVRDKTVIYLSIAAEQATDNYQNELALSLFDRLLAYVPENSMRRVEIADTRGDILDNVSEYDQAVAAYHTAIDVLLGLFEQGEHEEIQADLYRKMGRVYMNKGDYAHALKWTQRAVNCGADQKSSTMARAGAAMAAVLYRQGNANEALAWCSRSQTIAEEIENEEVLAYIKMLLGTIHTGLGDLDDAISYYQQSLELSLKLGDLQEQSRADNSLGAVYYYKGDWDQAVKHYSDSLDIAEQIGYIEQQATVSNNLGEVYMIRGEFGEAVDRFESCLRTWTRTGYQIGVAWSHRNLAQVYSNQRDWEQAKSHLNESLVTLAKLGARDYLTAEVYGLVAEVELGLGQWEAAWEQCQKALEIATSQDLKLVEGNARRVLGQLYAARQQWSEAEIEISASLKLATELGMRREQGQAILAMARLHADKWKQTQEPQIRAKAIMEVEQAATLFEELDSRWDRSQARLLQEELLNH